ncbi:MAG: class I SAM-dependent rRNA methyltransferase [Gemmatimonadaceae bacterium]
MSDFAVVAARGAKRWDAGHPWIYRSDVEKTPDTKAGAVQVQDRSGRSLGWALWSAESEISLRLLDREPGATIDGAWWKRRITRAAERRGCLQGVTNAYRLVHGEADGCPSLVCDRYDRWLVVQLLSAGVVSFTDCILDALQSVTEPEGILGRNDSPVRSKEGLPRATAILRGAVPREIEVEEHSIRFLAAPWDGQKTGAFLDQRENRVLAGSIVRKGGRALDCFSYHGSFALHMARHASEVTVVESSASAIGRAKENAQRNSLSNIRFREANAFDFLREEARSGKRYDTIVLDPPAFAKTRPTVPGALRGYKEINLRAMKLLSPGGMLLTASCSFHVGKAAFLQMLESAAADSGRRVALREFRGQPLDHPEVLTIPESGYLKAAVLEALS